jgi:hypothetical protein
MSGNLCRTGFKAARVLSWPRFAGARRRGDRGAARTRFGLTLRLESVSRRTAGLAKAPGLARAPPAQVSALYTRYEIVTSLAAGDRTHIVFLPNSTCERPRR